MFFLFSANTFYFLLFITLWFTHSFLPQELWHGACAWFSLPHPVRSVVTSGLVDIWFIVEPCIRVLFKPPTLEKQNHYHWFKSWYWCPGCSLHRSGGNGQQWLAAPPGNKLCAGTGSISTSAPSGWSSTLSTTMSSSGGSILISRSSMGWSLEWQPLPTNVAA